MKLSAADLGGPKLHPTRFDSDGQRLYYGKVDRGEWSFFHQCGDEEPARVGPIYRTKTELLGDAERYARFFGFNV